MYASSLVYTTSVVRGISVMGMKYEDKQVRWVGCRQECWVRCVYVCVLGYGTGGISLARFGSLVCCLLLDRFVPSAFGSNTVGVRTSTRTWYSYSSVLRMYVR